MSFFKNKSKFKRPADWPKSLEKLKERLALLAIDDPLWPLLLELVDQFIVVELAASVSVALDDSEAHRFRGRIGMLIDMRRDLEELLVAARAKKL